jgi:hypothetical protein
MVPVRRGHCDRPDRQADCTEDDRDVPNGEISERGCDANADQDERCCAAKDNDPDAASAVRRSPLLIDCHVDTMPGQTRGHTGPMVKPS